MSVAVPVTTSGAVRAAEAAALLYEHHHGRILAFCLRQLRNREEAEDAAQQTFLKAFGAMRGGFRPTVERAWLYRIAENVCADRGRANGRRVRHEATDGAAILEVIPARDSQAIDGLDEALAELTPSQRQALLLREWQGLSYREIASELELSQSAVETLLFRARRSLAKRLDTVPLIPWLKTMLLGSSGAKAVATVAVAVSVGVGAAAVAPIVLQGSTERAPGPTQSTPVMTPERMRDLQPVERSRAVTERAVQPSRRVGAGRVEAAPTVTASTSAPSAPAASASGSSKHDVPAPAANPPAPKLPAPTLPELPIEVPALAVPEVKLPEPTLGVPVLGLNVKPVAEPVQQVVDALPELPATLP
jgi:RNA polymerase sigma factor (sigma-70 family)